MKKFKIADTWISALLIIGFTIISMVRQDNTFITGYFAVGAWQIFSMLVHGANRWFTQKGTNRYYYHRAVGVTIILIALGFLVPPFFLVFYLLLFTAPFMAIYYTFICYREVYFKMLRPLALLK